MSKILGRHLVVERELVSAPGTFAFLCTMSDRTWNLETETDDTTGLNCDDPSGTPPVNTFEPVALNASLSVDVMPDTDHESVREMFKDIMDSRKGRYRITLTNVIQTVGLYLVSSPINAPTKGVMRMPVTLTPAADWETKQWLGQFAT